MLDNGRAKYLVGIGGMDWAGFLESKGLLLSLYYVNFYDFFPPLASPFIFISALVPWLRGPFVGVFLTFLRFYIFYITKRHSEVFYSLCSLAHHVIYVQEKSKFFGQIFLSNILLLLGNNKTRRKGCWWLVVLRCPNSNTRLVHIPNNNEEYARV